MNDKFGIVNEKLLLNFRTVNLSLQTRSYFFILGFIFPKYVDLELTIRCKIYI